MRMCGIIRWYLTDKGERVRTENLDFLTAVKALAEGKCEGITTPTHDVIYRRVQKPGCVVLTSDEGSYIAPDDYLKTDWQLVPMERVEVKRWMITNPAGGVYSDMNMTEDAAKCKADKMPCSVGPVKEPVVKRVEGRVSWHMGAVVHPSGEIQGDAMKWPALVGKIGKLTFEWTEP